jgi:PAS domain S-box-containing protein
MDSASQLLGKILVGATGRPAFRRYILALLFPLLAFLLTETFAQPDRGPYFPLFVAAVVIAAAYGGTGAGLAAVAESSAINILAVPPLLSLRIASSDDALRIAAFAVASSGIALLIGSLGELQQRLDKERSRLSITLQSIGDGVIATDAQGRVTLMNPAAERATGRNFATAAGLPLQEVFRAVHENNGMTVENPVERILERGQAADLVKNSVLLRPDGTEIPIESSAAAIRDLLGNTVGAVVVFRDVTESRSHQKALIRSEKLEAAGRLSATIAHETNNPLEVLANLLFLISQDSAVAGTTRELVDLAQAEISRVTEASRRTLSFVRFEHALTELNLRSLVNSILQSYQPSAKNCGICLENEIAPDLHVRALRNELQQLVSNLVSNAMDAMKTAGGVLRVSAEAAEQDGSGQVRIRFSDTGHGIDPGHLDRIFEPFFTTKKDQGTGLGLWIARRVVEDHEGELQVESSQAGTTFIVLLPGKCAGRQPGSDRRVEFAKTTADSSPSVGS